jgi:2-polyprenyl-6-methoxyphenol hydroxylase-like FAD-dependent oxidoreductase
MDRDVEVVVVGAGPTGLMLAGDLAQAGVSCVLLERRAERSGLTRAFTVHVRTLEQLDARGVADELIASGTPISELRYFHGAVLDLSGLPSRFPYVLIAPQYQTERVLEERARRLGADIRYGHEVSGLTRHPDGVEVEVRVGAGGVREGQQAKTIRTAYVVGADGMHSIVRRVLGMPFPGKPVVRSVMLAEVLLATQPPDVFTINTTGDSFAIIAPFGDGWYRVIAWHRHDQPPESDPVSLEEISETTRRALGTDYGMHDPRWMSRFHSEERQVPRYRDGRVLLAGDAAHVHSPAGGMGMNTSIQDAANLGWKLAATVHGWAPEGLLDSYNTERHPVGRHVLRNSGAIMRMVLTGPQGLGAARTLVARGITGTPFIAERIAGALSGLSISYPSPRGAHPLAGERVPDWQLADGRRLYEALRDGRFLLVGSHPIPADIASGYGDRVDTTNTAYPPGIIALIRPDAYIAWAAPWPDGRQRPQIHDALASWCGSPLQAVPSPRAGLPGPDAVFALGDDGRTGKAPAVPAGPGTAGQGTFGDAALTIGTSGGVMRPRWCGRRSRAARARGPRARSTTGRGRRSQGRQGSRRARERAG